MEKKKSKLLLLFLVKIYYITKYSELSEMSPVHEKLPKKRNTPGSSEKKKEADDKEISYKPFALGQFSSFNPAKLSNSKVFANEINSLTSNVEKQNAVHYSGQIQGSFKFWVILGV